MLEFSVCIEMFWRDLPMDERIRRVAALGFKAFEFWGWKDKNLEATLIERMLKIAEKVSIGPGNRMWP